MVAASVVCLLAAIGFSLWGSAGGVEIAAFGPRGQPDHRVKVATEDFVTPEPEPAVVAEADDGAGVGDAEPGSDDFDEINVHGRVVAMGAQPEDVRLVIESTLECALDDESCVRTRRTTDAETSGDFELEVPPGHYTLVARAAGFLPSVVKDLVVSKGDELGGIMLTLEKGEQISGRVRAQGEPSPGTRVVASGEGFTRVATTNDEGNFTIEGLPRGQFKVRAYLEGTGGDEQTVAGGDSVTLNLGHPGKVRGRVLDARGFPVEGAVVSSDYRITHYESDSDSYPHELNEYEGEGDMLGMHGCGPTPECYQRAVTDAAGRFELDTAPGESLTLAAMHDADRGEVEGVEFGASDIELHLASPTRVRFVDAQGQPAVGPFTLYGGSALGPRELVFGSDGWLTVPAASATVLQPPPGLKLASALSPGLTVQEPDVAPSSADDDVAQILERRKIVLGDIIY